MGILAWILQILLCLAFGAAGLMKVTSPRDKLAARMSWIRTSPPWLPNVIGVVELLGAVGVILPSAFRIMPVLTPLAACGLALIMIFATGNHLRHGEGQDIVPTSVLLVLALAVAYLRFGPCRIA